MGSWDICVYTFFLCIGLGFAQIHVGPINDITEDMSCPFCDGKAHSFPSCLAPSVKCHPQEVCAIMHSGDSPTYRCEKLAECLKHTAHPTGLCLDVEVEPGKCQKCCDTLSCVQEMTRQIKETFSDRLLCPGDCFYQDLDTCVQGGTYCSDGQFCEVTFGDHWKVQGQCRNHNEMQHCLTEQHNHPCVIAEHSPKCTWACCSDKACLSQYFSPYIVTDAISQTTQTQVAATTPPPTLAPTPAVLAGSTVKPAVCLECDGGFCHHNEKNVTCPGGYCMMTVEEDTMGSRFINKRCSNETECYDSWKNGWKDNQLCGSYLTSPSHISGQDMSCKFCCAGDNCNNHIDITNVLKY